MRINEPTNTQNNNPPAECQHILSEIKPSGPRKLNNVAIVTAGIPKKKVEPCCEQYIA